MVDTTGLDDVNTLYDMMNWVNSATGGIFVVFMVAMSFLIVMVVFNRYDIKKVLLFNSFAHSILVTFLIVMGWLKFEFLMLPVLGLFLILYLIIFGRD